MIGERFGFSMLFSAIGCFTLVVAATYTASCASALISIKTPKRLCRETYCASNSNFWG
jgi:hypothetical protein